jgi:thiol-disulfide isomerase/thioredoxin
MRNGADIDFARNRRTATMNKALSKPPELQVQRWFNSDAPISLAALRGKVVLVHAFQMLCPGCVSHAIPQANRLHELARGSDLVILGLHTVFEHHEAMTPLALEAFIHEYRITYPVGVDLPAVDGPIPHTMAAYRMRGTPTTLIFDRDGKLRHHSFGAEDDLALGFLLGSLLAIPASAAPHAHPGAHKGDGCDDGVCPIPGA